MPEFLTVPEVADLLRIKERKVYDMAASGDVPCTRATGKLLFPEAQLRDWIAGKQTGSATNRPAVFLGSHDPLLEWALRQSECGLATFFDGSMDGVDRFVAGEGMATGMHIAGDRTDTWNIDAVSERCANCDAVLIAWATRQRGLVYKSTTKVASVHDLAELRIAGRQGGSGAAALLDTLLRNAQIADANIVEVFHSEQDAALAVSENSADVTLGLEGMARQLNLAFLPLLEEQFDILVDRRAYFGDPFQTLLGILSDGEISRTRSSLGRL